LVHCWYFWWVSHRASVIPPLVPLLLWEERKEKEKVVFS
jgi:hypothetical protein